MDGRRILTDGLLACVPFTAAVWFTFARWPRMWLHSLPADIQALAPPKTSAERRLTAIVGPLVLLCFFGVPAALTWRALAVAPAGATFSAVLTHLYGVWMIVNLWDLVVIDWGYARWMDPERPPIPGTAGAAGWKDYGFHARACLKASVLGLGIIVPLALTGSWLLNH